MADAAISICVADFLCITDLWHIHFKVPPSEHLASSQTALDFELVHITAWQCTAALHQWKEGAQIRRDHIWGIHFQRRHTCLEKVRRLSKVQRIASPLMGRFSRRGSAVSLEGLSLWVTYLLGPRRWGLPSGHPGPLCSENTPAELRNKTTGSRRRQSSRSACQAHYSNTDAIGWGCWHLWRSLLSKLRGSTTHTHTQPHSLMMFPETSVRTRCKKEHFAVEVDLNRF